MPQTGVAALKGYLTGFFYLAAWGPLYVILHMICMTRATGAAQGVAEGGTSLGTYAGIGAVNAETATIAGFMLMSVPFLAAGLAKGAMSISGQATSVLSPAQNAAEAAAAEQTTGNYSYGNTSFANSTSNMRQSNQWSDAPTFATGGMSSSFRHDNGAFTTNNGDGFNVYDTGKAISNLPFSTSVVQSAMATESRQATAAARIADGFEQASRRETQHLEALRNGHTWGSTNSNGFDASLGIRGGTTEDQSVRNAAQQKSGVELREASGSGTTLQRTDGNTRTDAGVWAGGINVGIGGNAKAGVGAGPTGAGVSGKVDFTGGYNRSKTNADTRSTTDGSNSSHDKTIAATGGTSADRSVAAGTTVQDGDFYQQGRTARSEQSESRTRAIEESLTKINSYNEQARHYRELSQSLEQHASFAESNGFNLTTDLRNDLTRWYDKQNEASPGGNMLPGLWQTNLSPTQENARNLAIAKWAGQRSEGIEQDIQAALANPALSGMKVPGVTPEASVAARYSGGGALGGAHPVSVGKPDSSQARASIVAAAGELQADQRRLSGVAASDFAQAPPGVPKK